MERIKRRIIKKEKIISFNFNKGIKADEKLIINGIIFNLNLNFQ
jgi:hypothetical protein